MTTRLYYTDSSLCRFEAVVRSAERVEGRAQVLLDRTAFYPTSGGQPFDTGRLGGAEVIEVVDREDGEVVHVLATALVPGQIVEGEVDWGRRFDHMQQHTGQHLLSAALDRRFGVRTVSFHLGTHASTIDLARELSAAELDAAEDDANRIVWEDRAVVVRLVGADEAAALSLRKASDRTGTVRIVEVPGFDTSACGGTHVQRTGMVGVIAVTTTERFKSGTRVTFVCGGRATRSYRRLRDDAAAAARLLSVGSAELAPQLDRLQREHRELGRTLRDREQQLARLRAVEWLAGAEAIGQVRSVLRTDGSDAETLKAIAHVLAANRDVFVAIVGAGHPAPLVVARGEAVAFDAGAIVRQITAALGGRGGGRSDFAQAGVPASPDRVIGEIRRLLEA
jgi:alanyl-tRNA synthetase